MDVRTVSSARADLPCLRDLNTPTPRSSTSELVPLGSFNGARPRSARSSRPCSATSPASPPAFGGATRRTCSGGARALPRRSCAASSRATAEPSRSSSAKPWSPSSACRPSTRTTPNARCAPACASLEAIEGLTRAARRRPSQVAGRHQHRRGARAPRRRPRRARASSPATPSTHRRLQSRPRRRRWRSVTSRTGHRRASSSTRAAPVDAKGKASAGAALAPRRAPGPHRHRADAGLRRPLRRAREIERTCCRRFSSTSSDRAVPRS